MPFGPNKPNHGRANASSPAVEAKKGNGEWEYQVFNADKPVNQIENLDRWFSCHESRAHRDVDDDVDQ